MILHDESLTKLDYVAHGMITPHDVFKITALMAKEKYFELIPLFSAETIAVEPLSDRFLEFVPNKFHHLFLNFKQVYE